MHYFTRKLEFVSNILLMIMGSKMPPLKIQSGTLNIIVLQVLRNIAENIRLAVVGNTLVDEKKETSNRERTLKNSFF